MPVINVPVSRKALAAFIATGVLAGLKAIGVIHPAPDVALWISAGAALLAAAVVGEGAKYVNYFLAKRGIPARVEDKA